MIFNWKCNEKNSLMLKIFSYMWAPDKNTLKGAI